MKADALKKHHFWIVAGVSLVLVLLTFFMLSGGVSGAIAAKQGEISKAASTAASAKAPGKVALRTIEEQKKILERKKEDLWKENWNNQKQFYTWPSAPGNIFAPFESLKFGAPFDFKDEMFPVLRQDEVYRAMYEKMAASVAPTKFAGGWPNVLGERYIASWGEKKPEPRQLWLAMEDVWVLRALLDPIHTVNADAAKFELVPPPSGPLKRVFRSRTWQLDLEIVPQGNGQLIKAKLRNMTSQMQLLGSNSAMTLKIWLDPNLDQPPVEFKIEGEYVPGDTEITVSPLPSHLLPPGTNVTEIVKVEQVLDERTVPVRQIVQLSIKEKDSVGQYKNAALLPPSFWPDDAASSDASSSGAAAPAAAAPSATSAAAAGFGRGEGGRAAVPGAMGPGMGPAPAGGSGTAANLSLVQAVDEQRKRYLEVTDQLRRMPVAIKLIVDLRYMQDVMVAYTNSPMRLQLTQFWWSRFRGTLDAPGGDSGSSGGSALASAGAAAAPAVQGIVGEGLFSRMEGGRMEGGRGGGTLPARGGAPGPAMQPAPSAQPPAQPTPSGLPATALPSVSEAQANSALVELTLFGIVTLYEKFEPKPDPNAPATPEAAPSEKPMSPDAPMSPGAPMNPKTPMDAATTPKEQSPTPAAPEKKN